jgi:hypothetical protein
MDCPNLRELAGERYRVRRETGISRDPWNDYIPCLRGHICPWGSDLLAACTDRRRPGVLQKLLDLPGSPWSKTAKTASTSPSRLNTSNRWWRSCRPVHDGS